MRLEIIFLRVWFFLKLSSPVGEQFLQKKDVVHHERNQLSQLVADAGLVVPSVANGAQKLSNIQISVFAAGEKKRFYIY